MALSQSLKFSPVIVEAYVTLPVVSGTVVGPAIPAGCVVVSAGIEFAGTILGGVTPVFNAAADTIDAVMVVSGAGLVAADARIWAVVVNVNECTKEATEVARDQLA